MFQWQYLVLAVPVLFPIAMYVIAHKFDLDAE